METGVRSSEASADLGSLPAGVVDFAVKQSDNWLRAAKEAYVAALPPRDQELGAAVMLGDGTLSNDTGRLYSFVSRSMPRSLLRAYARDALFLDATLVVKGVRKGTTIKEYMEEAVAEFNSAEGQVLAGIDINPNLFDMFNIQTVPAVVWTNRMGLDDVGNGCPRMPEGSAPVISLPGPDGSPLFAERPTCAPAPESSYFKISGALSMPYVLDRFEAAGAPKIAMDKMRTRLAEHHANVHQGSQEADGGNNMAPVSAELRLDQLPRRALEFWREELKTKKVMRGPYGPVFGTDAEEDPAYRAELQAKIRRGLAGQ